MGNLCRLYIYHCGKKIPATKPVCSFNSEESFCNGNCKRDFGKAPVWYWGILHRFAIQIWCNKNAGLFICCGYGRIQFQFALQPYFKLWKLIGLPPIKTWSIIWRKHCWPAIQTLVVTYRRKSCQSFFAIKEMNASPYRIEFESLPIWFWLKWERAGTSYLLRL